MIGEFSKVNTDQQFKAAASINNKISKTRVFYLFIAFFNPGLLI
jgi:hypothetical protein